MATATRGGTSPFSTERVTKVASFMILLFLSQRPLAEEIIASTSAMECHLDMGPINWYQSRFDSSHGATCHGSWQGASSEQPPQPCDSVLGAYGDPSSTYYGSRQEVPPEPPPQPSISSEERQLQSWEGLTFDQSSRDPKYNIEFHSAKSPFHPDEGQESIMMSNKEGKNFMCFLPIVEETKPVKQISQQNSSSIIVETDRRTKLKTPDELLDVLKDKCLYRHEGWWSYEFCHLKKLRQLHLEDDKAVQEFYLGMFDSEETTAFNQNHSDDSLLKDPRSKHASQRYHAHKYTNGTVCDLTNHPRETEVRFVCSETPVVISSIKEISTCKYVVTVQCPLLCKHPLFQQEKSMSHTIHCNEMLGDNKDSSVVEDRVRGTQIIVITEDIDQYAT